MAEIQITPVLAGIQIDICIKVFSDLHNFNSKFGDSSCSSVLLICFLLTVAKADAKAVVHEAVDRRVDHLNVDFRYVTIFQNFT